MSKQLKQVINLSKKTGDRIIVFDNSEPDNSFVVMTLEQYEGLVGDNFGLGDKNFQNYNNSKKNLDTSNRAPVGDNNQGLTEKKIIDKIGSTENNEQNNSSNRNFRNNNWQIPPQIKQESEE